MELYTSLIQLKIALNGGVLPPMTPLTAKAAAVLDPDFTIGMGALTEDADKGLRCPVRGCGEFHHFLATHLTKSHSEIGGARGVRNLLEIPQSARLVSSVCRAKMIARAEKARPRLLMQLERVGPRARAKARKASTKRSKISNSAGMRNLINRCEAQMRHALIDLQHKIGRSPSYNEAKELIGYGFVQSVIRVYGSWNAAKARFGLDQYKAGGVRYRDRLQRSAVLESLAAYYETHGCLPNVRQAEDAKRAPLIPHRKAICKVLGTESWPEAMRRAAALLNIYGGRYGLPPKKASAA